MWAFLEEEDHLTGQYVLLNQQFFCFVSSSLWHLLFFSLFLLLRCTFVCKKYYNITRCTIFIHCSAFLHRLFLSYKFLQILNDYTLTGSCLHYCFFLLLVWPSWVLFTQGSVFFNRYWRRVVEIYLFCVLRCFSLENVPNFALRSRKTVRTQIAF